MSRPLRIAMFVGCFPVVSETFIVRQVAGLLELGHEVHLFSELRGPTDGPLPPEITRFDLLKRTTFLDLPPECAPWELPAYPADGETWIPGAATALPNRERLARAAPVMERCRQRCPTLAAEALSEKHHGHRAASLSAVYRLDRLSAITAEFDLVHAHFGPTADSIRFVRALWGRPLVASFHGYDFCTVPRQQGRGVYDALFREADAVTVNSRYTRVQLERLGCPAAKLRLLPVGLDPAAFEFRERQPGPVLRLLTVARLVEIKGHEYCLRAVAELVRAGLPVHYDLVGDGPWRARLEALAGELGLTDRVTFHGSQSGERLRALLAEAHLFLLCSVSVQGDQEGQGLALQEAQACGLPVVTTTTGGLPEGLIPDQSGLVVPERNVEALATALQWLHGHPERWPAMGRCGREFVARHFDIKQLNKTLVSLYQELVHLPSKPSDGSCG